MIIIVCSVIAILTVPLVGGDLRAMSSLPIRHSWLVWAAIGIQTVLVSGPLHLPQHLAEAIHLGTYAFAAAFALVNMRLPGVAVISLGGALNLSTIAANGGVMPASAAAVRTAGLATATGFTNSGYVAHARLAWFGDVFAIPSGWPLANVFSVGDVLVVVGVAWLAHRWCRHARPVDDTTAVVVPHVSS